MAEMNMRVGEYVLDLRVGGGGFGEVWRAHHHVWSDRLVAVKIPTDPQYVRALQHEGAAIHGLTHPNIVRAMGFDPYADPPYLTMEYVPGTSLRPLIGKKSLGVSDAVAILSQVLAGLAHAHGQGLVHRDIKPENILVHERTAGEGFGVEGLVKVTDFGLGKAAVSAKMGSILLSGSLESPAGREIAGTLDYMAPEQRNGDALDGRADLYACGVMWYEMLTGERPAGTDVPGDLVAGMPKWVDEVFRRSYSRLDRRYETAEAFLAALNRHEPPPLPGSGRGGTVSRTPVRPAGGRICPQCRQAVGVGDQFCMACGIQLAETVRRCGKCGSYPALEDQYCIFCGGVLEGAPVTA